MPRKSTTKETATEASPTSTSDNENVQEEVEAVEEVETSVTNDEAVVEPEAEVEPAVTEPTVVTQHAPVIDVNHRAWPRPISTIERVRNQ